MQRKVLVVGGAGLIGGASALLLAQAGHQVTIAGRRPPSSRLLGRLPFLQGSYLSPEDFEPRALSRFDSLVFAAANDVRQLPSDADETAYFDRANAVGVPAFVDKARRAGIAEAVYVGSLYPQVVAPERMAASGYILSRKRADDGVRALAGPGFKVCSLNAPFIMGYIEGVHSAPIEHNLRYLLGLMGVPGPLWMIPGGSNFMSARSFAQAVEGALAHGESGAAYLVGDENWTYVHYYNLVLRALGRPEIGDIRDEEHPSMPDASLYGGRGVMAGFDPDPAMVARLGYDRHDAERAVVEMAPCYQRALAGEPPPPLPARLQGRIDAFI